MAAQGAHRQHGHRTRFDWGPVGAAHTVDPEGYAVVVDVISFTTTLSVCLDRGTEVIPFPWRDDHAAEVAREQGAVLARGRSEGASTHHRAGGSTPSLSPASIRDHDGPLPLLLLPSPNGSTIAHQLAGTGAVVLGAGLRNAAAVARWVLERAGQDPVVTVVAAGERWPDGTLRPAVEDLWGAGAVVEALGPHGRSPEAEAAAAAWRGVRDDLGAQLAACAGGVELSQQGWHGDVVIAAEAEASTSVPVLCGGRFVDGT